DLALPLMDGIRHDAVEADGGETEREQSEDAEQDNTHARLKEAAFDDLFAGAHVADEEFRSGSEYFTLYGEQDEMRVRLAAHVQDHGVRLVLRERQVHAGLRRLGPGG